jgi:hypothetical protein
MTGCQIAGPYPCEKSYFHNCKRVVANDKTGAEIYVGAPTGTARFLTVGSTATCRRSTNAGWNTVRGTADSEQGYTPGRSRGAHRAGWLASLVTAERRRPRRCARLSR